MNHVCIFEDLGFQSLLPLTSTRPVYDLLSGTSVLFEKFYRYFSHTNINLHCRPYLKPSLKKKYPGISINKINSGLPCLFLNGRVLMTEELYNRVTDIDEDHNYLFTYKGDLIALYLCDDLLNYMIDVLHDIPSPINLIQYFRNHCISKELDHVHIVRTPWDLISLNSTALKLDFAFRNQPGIVKGDIKPFASIYNENNVYVGRNTVIEDFVVINAEKGPVYIEEDVLICSGSRLEGPLYIGKHSHILGARLSASSIGPFCKVGGEISNSIFYGFSNKAHDGFLGHSYIGEWVNLGAGTITSNLKNTYGKVSISTPQETVDTGLQFLGSIIGDHCKTSIGTRLPTGCIVSYGCNLIGSEAHAKFVPPFRWGAAQHYEEFKLGKFIDIAKKMMLRRKRDLLEPQQDLIHFLFGHQYEHALNYALLVPIYEQAMIPAPSVPPSSNGSS